MDRRDKLVLRRQKIRREVFEILGGVFCQKCGNTDIRVLTINHLDGHKEPKTQRINPRRRYRDIVNGVTSKEELKYLNVLCQNCNILYEYERENRFPKMRSPMLE